MDEGRKRGRPPGCRKEINDPRTCSCSPTAGSGVDSASSRKWGWHAMEQWSGWVGGGFVRRDEPRETSPSCPCAAVRRALPFPWPCRVGCLGLAFLGRFLKDGVRAGCALWWWLLCDVVGFWCVHDACASFEEPFGGGCDDPLFHAPSPPRPPHHTPSSPCKPRRPLRPPSRPLWRLEGHRRAHPACRRTERVLPNFYGSARATGLSETQKN